VQLNSKGRNKLNKFVIVGGVLLLLLLVNNTRYSNALETSMPKSAASALDGIQQAEASGAEVSELINRFNNAMDLLEQAETSDFRSCNSYDECIQSADKMFVDIANDAAMSKQQTENLKNEEVASSVLYAIIVAFVISFLALSLYRLGKQYQMQRFLDMEIREK